MINQMRKTRTIFMVFRVYFFIEKGCNGMDSEQYRLRDKQLNIRVTEYEYALIKQRMKESGSSSLREFVVDAATNGFLINVDYSDIKELAYEVNRIGNNINQIAHRINSEGTIYKKEIEEVQQYVDMIWKMLRAKFYQTP